MRVWVYEQRCEERILRVPDRRLVRQTGHGDPTKTSRCIATRGRPLVVPMTAELAKTRHLHLHLVCPLIY